MVEASSYVRNPNFNQDQFLNLLSNVLEMVFTNPTPIEIKEQDERIKVYVRACEADDMPTIAAMGDLFYPYGIRQGQKIEIRPVLENPSLRSSKIPR
jgi:hypothetical protein